MSNLDTYEVFNQDEDSDMGDEEMDEEEGDEEEEWPMVPDEDSPFEEEGDDSY